MKKVIKTSSGSKNFTVLFAEDKHIKTSNMIIPYLALNKSLQDILKSIYSFYAKEK